MKRILLFTALIIGAISTSFSQIVINEISDQGDVELTNIGTESVNVATYQLCNWPAYQSVGTATLLCGDAMLAPGEFIVVSGFDFGFDAGDGEMGLYLNNDWDNPSSIIDYVEWGSTAHFRSGTAVGAGVWTSGDFVASFDGQGSLEYDGSGDESTNWAGAAENSLCSANSNVEGGCDTEGGTVETSEGETVVYTCPGDDVADEFTYANTGSGGTGYAYVVTSPELEILGILEGNVQDFDGAGEGECWVWGLSFSGNVTAMVGDNAGEVDITDECWDLSDNFIQVNRQVPEGGTVSTTNEETMVYTCPGDEIADIVNVMNTGSGGNYAYVITDPELNILGINPDSMLDFEGAGEGECWVWGLAYTGNVLVEVGDNAGDGGLTDDCFDLSDNYVTVVRGLLDAGTVTSNGETMISTCAGDGEADVVEFATDGFMGESYGWVITDTELNILGLPEGPMADFEGAGAGECWVWGLAYNGTVTAMMGDNAGEVALTDGCWALSEAFITVNRTEVNGGTVSTPDGETSVTTCTQNGVADIVDFESADAAEGLYTYVITDPEGNILGLPEGNSNDFDGAPAGTCYVWGLSYSGEILVEVGDNALEVALTDGCYDLSDNWIEVIRESQDGGTVATDADETMVYTCPGDEMADIVNFMTTSEAENYTYVITDSDLNILGLPEGPMADFEGAGEGECWVWGLAYTGEILVEMGDNAGEATLTDGCYSLSENFITVIRGSLDAGTVTGNGESTVYTCPGDEMEDIVNFASEGAVGENYAWVITDPDLNILGLPEGPMADFEGAGEGECWVWGLSYNGTVIAEMGDNAGEVDLVDGCWALSEAFITVIRTNAEGGTVSTVDGENTVITCTQNGIADIIEFQNEGASNAGYVYVVTDPEGNILGLPEGNSNDFDGAPAGTCYVWGLSYTGNITAEVGDNATEIDLSDGCYDLSDNWIEVIRESQDGGMVATDGDETVVYTCPGDEIADVVNFTTTSEDENYAYVITDTDLNILGIPEGPMADFEGAGEGECWVWGLSYTGNVLVEVGDNAADVLADGCYDLSDNFISVMRGGLDAGVVTGNGETMIYTCPGDGIEDIVDFATDGSTGESYGWVITDTDLNILGLPEGPMADFEGAGSGECWVWGLAYNGTVTAEVGDNVGDIELVDGCFDLSDSPISVFRDMYEGGTVATTEGLDLVYTCPGDEVSDIVNFEATDAVGENYAWVITDADLTILGLPEGPMADFEGAGAGECWVWGLSYTGNVTAMMGDNAGEVDLTDGCWSLSDNFITVIRAEADGGTVSSNGQESVTICVQDGVADVVEFSSEGASDANFTYVITDENGIILGIPEGDSNDFDDAPEGLCLVWGLSYTGEITAEVGDDATAVDLASGCFDLSDNWIEVNRYEVEGGEVSIVGGNDEVTIVVGDGNADLLEFETTSTIGEEYAYIITDDSGNILAVLDGNSNDFEGAEAGICWVYGVSYSGTLDAEAGDNIDDISSDECYQLSSNNIIITRTMVDSVGEIDGLALNVYPNPTSSNVIVELNPAFNVSTIEVLDMEGRSVLSIAVNANDALVNVSLEELATGSYILRAVSENKISHTRITKL